MDAVKYYCVGKIKDAHGIKGEVFVYLFSEESPWLDQLSELNLGDSKENPRGDAIHSIEKMSAHKDGYIVRLKSITTRNQSELLKGKFIFIPEEWLVSNKGEEAYLLEFLNMSVFNKGERIGQVIEFDTNGTQDLLVVETEKGEVLIPLVQAFVESIDFEAKILKLNLPEGLVEE